MENNEVYAVTVGTEIYSLALRRMSSPHTSEMFRTEEIETCLEPEQDVRARKSYKKQIVSRSSSELLESSSLRKSVRVHLPKLHVDTHRLQKIATENQRVCDCVHCVNPPEGENVHIAYCSTTTKEK